MLEFNQLPLPLLAMLRLMFELALLISLLSIWQKTGAAQAFASTLIQRWQFDQVGLKKITWGMGLFFCQSGTFSAIVVGSSLRPLKDRLQLPAPLYAFLLDSMAAPVAGLLMLNAWPAFLMTVLADSRLAAVPLAVRDSQIIWQSLPISFYSIGMIMLSGCLAWSKLPWLEARFLRHLPPDPFNQMAAFPVKQEQLALESTVTAKASDFLMPWAVMLVLVAMSLVIFGKSHLFLAFFSALALSIVLARHRGHSWSLLLKAILGGLKKSLIVVLVLIGGLLSWILAPLLPSASQFSDQFLSYVPYYFLPVILQLLAMIIAFCIGTSWGTFFIVIPTGLATAWFVADSLGLNHPSWFLVICFAAMKEGAVFGDQSSPMSDTSIASSLISGCPLHIHIRCQLPFTLSMAAIAGILWTCLCYWSV